MNEYEEIALKNSVLYNHSEVNRLQCELDNLKASIVEKLNELTQYSLQGSYVFGEWSENMEKMPKGEGGEWISSSELAEALGLEYNSVSGEFSDQ